MNANTDPIVVQQTYNASPAQVWQAITDPAKMRQWYFEAIEDFRAEPGFATKFDVECGDRVYVHDWKVTEVVPQQRIAYEWRFGGYPGDSVVVWDLEETDGGTKLTLSHHDQHTFGNDPPEFARDSCEGGWKYFLQESLKKFLDG